MISKWRYPPIATVHFKNQLPVLLLSRLSSWGITQDRAMGHNPNQRSSLGALMLKSGLSCCLNAHLTTYSFCFLALKLSANNGFFPEVKQLHSHFVKLGYYDDLSVQNQILRACGKCGEFWDMDQLFDEMPVRNILSWNTMVTGAASSDSDANFSVQLGFRYFKRMLLEMVQPDSRTMNALICACIALNDLRIGRHLHGFVMKVGLSLDCFVGSAIVDLYGKLGLVRDARCVFFEMNSKDLVSWNVMLSAYAFNCLAEEAFRVFRTMHLEGFLGDEFTFTSLLSSCRLGGCSELGKQCHGLVTKLSFDLDLQVASVLVDMYAKNGSIIKASKVFDGMVGRNLVSWNTMIVGYGQQGYGKKALELFVEMVRRDINPDEHTLASIISSCGNLSATSEITQIHAFMIKSRLEAHLLVANATIVAYFKCGSLASACKCFNSVKEPDLVTWTSIINAHAFHGKVEKSVHFFEMMLLRGLRPDDIAFLGILSACRHAGLVREGLRYFRLMVTDYSIIPNSEHYACLVDLLGRAGLIDEASRILTSGSVGFESNTLGALVGASKARGHVELAEWAAGKLFELEPDNPVNYTLMSNLYASMGQWNDAARVRKMMKHKCDTKVPGCSWIEIAGKVHTFLSCDVSHPLAQEVYSMLGLLIRLLKEDECVKFGT